MPEQLFGRALPPQRHTAPPRIMKPLAQCRLYTFVDTAYLAGRKPADVAEQLCRGGADLIQLRAKNSAPDEIRRMAEEIIPILDNYGVGLVINDHWQIAREVGADFCHLGQEDFFGSGPMDRSDAKPLLGLSTHAPTQAGRALAAHPAYIAIGPVYATPTKPQARPVTLDYVQWAAAHVKIPWFAIGGINLGNLSRVLAAGATRICVVSAILKAPDMADACRRFRGRLAEEVPGAAPLL